MSTSELRLEIPAKLIPRKLFGGLRDLLRHEELIPFLSRTVRWARSLESNDSRDALAAQLIAWHDEWLTENPPTDPNHRQLYSWFTKLASLGAELVVSTTQSVERNENDQEKALYRSLLLEDADSHTVMRHERVPVVFVLKKAALTQRNIALIELRLVGHNNNAIAPHPADRWRRADAKALPCPASAEFLQALTDAEQLVREYFHTRGENVVAGTIVWRLLDYADPSKPFDWDSEIDGPSAGGAIARGLLRLLRTTKQDPDPRVFVLAQLRNAKGVKDGLLHAVAGVPQKIRHIVNEIEEPPNKDRERRFAACIVLPVAPDSEILGEIGANEIYPKSVTTIDALAEVRNEDPEATELRLVAAPRVYDRLRRYFAWAAVGILFFLAAERWRNYKWQENQTRKIEVLERQVQSSGPKGRASIEREDTPPIARVDEKRKTRPSKFSPELDDSTLAILKDVNADVLERALAALKIGNFTEARNLARRESEAIRKVLVHFEAEPDETTKQSPHGTRYRESKELEARAAQELGENKTALDAYNEALRFTSENKNPEEWGRLNGNLAKVAGSLAWTLQWQSDTTSDKEKLAEAARLRGLAIQSLNKSTRFYTRKEHPTTWANLQNSLGNVLAEDARVAKESQIKSLLFAAKTVYEASLKEYTKQEEFEEAARAQHNLANVLRSIAGITEKREEKIGYLNKSIEAYQSARKERTSKKQPDAYVRTQMALAATIRDLAQISDARVRDVQWDRAIKIYEDVAEVRTQTDFLQDWAAAEHERSNTLMQKAYFASPPERAKLLAAAVDILEKVALAREQAGLFQAWTKTKIDQASALRAWAWGSTGNERRELWERAVKIYEVINTVHKEAMPPEEWTASEHERANTLRQWAADCSGSDRAKLLASAVEAYDGVALAREKSGLWQAWAKTKMDQANALRDLAQINDDGAREAQWNRAIKIYEDVAEIRTQTDFLEEWAAAEHERSNTLMQKAFFASLSERAKLLATAVDTLEKVALAREQAGLFQAWTKTKIDQASALRAWAWGSTGNERRELWERAVKIYELMATVRTKETAREELVASEYERASTLRQLAGDYPGPEKAKLLASAVDILEKVARAREQAGPSQAWAKAKMDQASALLEWTAAIESDEKRAIWKQAVKTLEEIASVRNSDVFPEEWAIARQKLNETLFAQAEESDGAERAELIQKLAQIAKEELALYKLESRPADIAKTNVKLALIAMFAETESGDPEPMHLKNLIRAANESLPHYSGKEKDELLDLIREIELQLNESTPKQP